MQPFREAVDALAAELQNALGPVVDQAADAIGAVLPAAMEGASGVLSLIHIFNFLIVHKPALIKFDRHIAGPTVIGPDMNPDADASIVKYRKYGLVDGYENKRAGIYLSHK